MLVDLQITLEIGLRASAIQKTPCIIMTDCINLYPCMIHVLIILNDDGPCHGPDCVTMCLESETSLCRLDFPGFVLPTTFHLHLPSDTMQRPTYRDNLPSELMHRDMNILEQSVRPVCPI